jgi:hypothetical protein
MRAKNLLQTSLQLEVCIKSYGPPKLQESQFREFWDSQLESPGTKWHLGVGPMAMHIKYYKGEGGGFPPSPNCGESCEFVFTRGLSVHQKCYNYAQINLLFGLCWFMWIIDPLVTLPNPHPEVPTCPFTPKVLQAREHTPTPYPFVVPPWTRSWVYQKAWGWTFSHVTLQQNFIPHNLSNKALSIIFERRGIIVHNLIDLFFSTINTFPHHLMANTMPLCLVVAWQFMWAHL